MRYISTRTREAMVKDFCTLQKGALDIQVNNQIEDLELDINQTDAREHFSRTYITNGLKELCRYAVNSFAKKQTCTGVVLKQALGGGKTHLMKCLALLCRDWELRSEIGESIDPSLPWKNFQSVKVAAFNGRNQPEEFFWGDIARQLGGTELFRKHWQNGPEAPGADKWAELFQAVTSPVLVLLDEMPPYFEYYATQPACQGTVAGIISKAYSNMLHAAQNSNGNVFVLVSTLEGTYKAGAAYLTNAVNDGERRFLQPVTPVSLESNEIYGILRKCLFESIDESHIDSVLEEYSEATERAIRAGIIDPTARQNLESIRKTYPFHPSIQPIVALFRESSSFQQTRGLLALVSRMLKSVWEGKYGDASLIGIQHMDIALQDVRDKLSELSKNQEAISHDIWNADDTSAAQAADTAIHSTVASQVATMVFMSSLGENAAGDVVRGLSEREIYQNILSPSCLAVDAKEALSKLREKAWYLHESSDRKFYFDRNQNLTSRLASYAANAPQDRLDSLIQDEITALFSPGDKTAYEEVLYGKTVEEIQAAVRSRRVLYLPSSNQWGRSADDILSKLMGNITEKNNILLLFGQRGYIAEGDIESQLRMLYAVRRTDQVMGKNDPQREELEDKMQAVTKGWKTLLLHSYDKVAYFVNDRVDGKPIHYMDNASTAAAICKVLEEHPQRLVRVDEQSWQRLAARAEKELFNPGNPVITLNQLRENLKVKTNMLLLPARDGLETLIRMACSHERWQKLDDGSITCKPKPKQTGVAINQGSPEADGSVRLQVQAVNGGKSPHIHYAEDGEVSEQSPLLQQEFLDTKALRVRFLVVDPTGKYETGEPYVWTNELILRNNLENGEIQLLVAPKGVIRYTTDGSNPRHGGIYSTPIPLPAEGLTIQAFAECEGLETTASFTFSGDDGGSEEIDDSKPAKLVCERGSKSPEASVLDAIDAAALHHISFSQVTLYCGSGQNRISLNCSQNEISAAQLKGYADMLPHPDKGSVPVLPPGCPLELNFRSCQAETGAELKAFLKAARIEYKPKELQQA